MNIGGQRQCFQLFPLSKLWEIDFTVHTVYIPEIMTFLQLSCSYLPCLEHAVLQGAGIAEGHVPWVGALVHGVEVEGCLQLRLAARQEHDAGDGGGHAAAQHAQGVGGHGLRGALVGVVGT